MTGLEKVRLDKWLWAARLYKTRAIAKHAIEGGKVRIAGQRTKPSKEITINTLISLRQGWDDKTLLVTALSDQRRNATEAAELYTETPESIEKRIQIAQQRKNSGTTIVSTDGRPSKKQRRQIHRFRENNLSE